MDGLFVPFNARMGRPPKFTPAQLLHKFEEYIADREARPLIDKTTESGTTGNNTINKETQRATPHLLSIGDFCVFLGTSRNWWNELTDDYLGVKTRISTYISEYQLKGASNGVFNANIVARLLGLADKQQVTTEGQTRIVVENAEQKAKLQAIGDIEK